MSERKGLLGRLLETGAKVASEAARSLTESDRARGAAASAVGVAQRGKRRLDEAQEKVLHLLGLAAKEDYAEVAKRMARLKRKVRELSRQIDQGGAAAAGSGGGEGAAEAEEPGEPEGDDHQGGGGARR